MVLFSSEIYLSNIETSNKIGHYLRKIYLSINYASFTNKNKFLINILNPFRAQIHDFTNRLPQFFFMETNVYISRLQNIVNLIGASGRKDVNFDSICRTRKPTFSPPNSVDSHVTVYWVRANTAAECTRNSINFHSSPNCILMVKMVIFLLERP